MGRGEGNAAGGERADGVDGDGAWIAAEALRREPGGVCLPSEIGGSERVEQRLRKTAPVVVPGAEEQHDLHGEASANRALSTAPVAVFFFATARGGPAATIRPPRSPPSGPSSTR